MMCAHHQSTCIWCLVFKVMMEFIEICATNKIEIFALTTVNDMIWFTSHILPRSYSLLVLSCDQPILCLFKLSRKSSLLYQWLHHKDNQFSLGKPSIVFIETIKTLLNFNNGRIFVWICRFKSMSLKRCLTQVPMFKYKHPSITL